MCRPAVVLAVGWIFTLHSVAWGQLHLKHFPPRSEEARKLVEQVTTLRNGLSKFLTPKSLQLVPSKLAPLIRLTQQAADEETRIAGAEVNEVDELLLLKDGLERLKERAARIQVLLKRKERRLAAKLMRDVAVMDRLWTDTYDPDHQPLVQWSAQTLEDAGKLELPFLTLEVKLLAEARSGKLEQALKTIGELIELKKKGLGPRHTDVGVLYKHVSDLEIELGHYPEALAAQKQLLEITRDVSGPDSREVKSITLEIAVLERQIASKSTTNALWVVHQLETSAKLVDLKLTEKRIQNAEQDLQAIEQDFGRENAAYARATVALAACHLRLGQLQAANHFFFIGDQLAVEVYGPTHPYLLEVYYPWGYACELLNDVNQSLRVGVRAVTIARLHFGEEEHKYLAQLDNLAAFYQTAKAGVPARNALERSSKIKFALGGPEDLQYAVSLRNLISHHMKQGEADQARALLPQALQIFQLPKFRRDKALPLLRVMEAELADGAGEQQKAEQIYQELLQDARRDRQNKHHLAADLSNLAMHYQHRGEHTRAEPLFRESLKVRAQILDGVSRAQSQRQQIHVKEETLPVFYRYLTSAQELPDQAQQIYEHVLAWKGSVFRFQYEASPARAADSLVARQLDYGKEIRRLSNLATIIDTAPHLIPSTAVLDRLLRAKEDRWREIVYHSAPKASATPVSIQDIQNALPENTKLIDFVYYQHAQWQIINGQWLDESEFRLLAFVISKTGPVEMLPLGAGEKMDGLIKEWRNALMRGGGGLAAGPNADKLPQTILRNWLWAPLEPKLAGATHVLICPDNLLGVIPWGAFASSRPGHYLLEDLSISLVPFAQMVAEKRAASDKPISLLLVGDPDYQPAPAAGTSSATRFTPLPGTAREIAAIQTLYQSQQKADNLTRLSGPQATEAAIRQIGPGVRYLHLATHGFFAPEIWRSSPTTNPQQEAGRHHLEAYYPELLSGMALAGANALPQAFPGFDQEDFADDGILTALEVTSLDLSQSELVVLSACETTFGRRAELDGMLGGLQQAFMLAGAKSTATSLWPVDDTATQVLMVEFYRNLWEKQLPKAEALRQAQLTLLERYDAKTHLLASRGLKLVDKNKPGSAPAPTLPPLYWASFVLNGDWR